MSVPARKLPTPAPRTEPRRPRGGAAPQRRHGLGISEEPRGAGAHRRAQRVDGAKRPLRSEAPRSTPATSRRPKHHLGFALFASTLVGLIVLAIVVLQVLLAQQSFRIDEAERRVDALAQERLQLMTEQATLSAPGRIAGWASRHGMRLPDDIRILRAPNGSSDPAGAGTSEAED